MPQDSKTIIQKIVLKTDEYSASIRKANSDLKKNLADMNKTLFESSKQFLQSEVQVKQWGATIKSEASKAARAFGDNLMTGAKALTLDMGREALHQAAKDATQMAFSFSKAFAEIKSRSNASESDLQKWRNRLMQISVDTTANMDSMAESFKDLFSSVKNPDELLRVMNSIGDAAAMGDGDATKVSSFVKSTLQGQGREVNLANVNDVLGASDILRRNGNGFANLQDAMGAMGSLSGQDIQRSKLSERQLAALMAGATKTGSEKGAAISGMTELIQKSNNGIMQGSVLAGILGAGRLTDKSGRFDVSRLGGAYQKVLAMGGGNENRAREIFAATSGLQNSDAIFNLLKNFKSLSATMQDAEKDTKDFAQSAAEGKDNLENAYKGFTNTLIKGVSDIFGGAESPIKKLLHGDISGAAKGVPSALGQMAHGIAEHPLLVGGAIASTALVGSLVKGIGGKLLGGRDFGDTMKGVGIGKALQEMGVQPVYVVNAADMRNDQSTTMGAVKEMMGAGGAAAGGAAGLGSRALPFLGKAGMVGLAGAAGWAAGRGADWATDKAFGYSNQYGQHVSPMERMMAKLTPEWAGGMTSEQYKDMYVQVEVISKDPGLRAIPKANDNRRDTRNH